MQERDDEDEREPEPAFLSVAVYEVNRSFGGREEGGWWYDVGEPTTNPALAIHTRIFTEDDMEAMRRYADTLRPLCDEANKRGHRLPPGSMGCTGYYEVRVETGYPAPFPSQRPRYE